MKEYEIKIGEEMKPYNVARVKTVDVYPEDEDRVDDLIKNALSNPFSDVVTTYIIRIKETNVKRIITIPDFINNNAKLLSINTQTVDGYQRITMYLNGFCRDCKFSFFIYGEDDKIEGE